MSRFRGRLNEYWAYFGFALLGIGLACGAINGALVAESGVEFWRTQNSLRNSRIGDASSDAKAIHVWL